MRIGLFRIAVPLAVCSGLALSCAASSADEPNQLIANGGLMHTLGAAPVLGQPYSAVQVSQIVRKLADGTTIKNGPGSGHAVMRDSAGRVRVERRISRPGPGDPGIMLVFVLDPVEHMLTTWSTGGKGEQVAVQIKLPATKTSAAEADNARQPAVDTSRPQPVITTEKLGTEMIEGLPVEVVKTTTVVPAGRSGNDAPIAKWHETWTSEDLKLTMKQQSYDPRSGELTIWLTRFSRSEPDAAMFRAPTGYKVQDLKQTMQELTERLNAIPE